jgi:GAF domain-containing protein
LPALAAVVAILTRPGTAADRLVLGGMAVLVSLLTLVMLRHDRRLAIHERHLLDAQEESLESHRVHSQRLRGVLEVSRVLNAETEPQAVFDAIASICKATFPCDQVSLMLLDRDTQELVVRAAAGHDDLTHVLGARRKLGEGMSGWVAQHREPLVLGPEVDHPARRPYPASASLTAAMLVPILVRDELDGVLNVSSRTAATRYGPDDLRALQVFAENAGTCIRHSERAAWSRRVIAAYQTGAVRDPRPEPSTKG